MGVNDTDSILNFINGLDALIDPEFKIKKSPYHKRKNFRKGGKTKGAFGKTKNNSVQK